MSGIRDSVIAAWLRGDVCEETEQDEPGQKQEAFFWDRGADPQKKPTIDPDAGRVQTVVSAPSYFWQ